MKAMSRIPDTVGESTLQVKTRYWKGSLMAGGAMHTCENKLNGSGRGLHPIEQRMKGVQRVKTSISATNVVQPSAFRRPQGIVTLPL